MIRTWYRTPNCNDPLRTIGTIWLLVLLYYLWYQTKDISSLPPHPVVGVTEEYRSSSSAFRSSGVSFNPFFPCRVVYKGPGGLNDFLVSSKGDRWGGVVRVYSVLHSQLLVISLLLSLPPSPSFSFFVVWTSSQCQNCSFRVSPFRTPVFWSTPTSLGSPQDTLWYYC